MILDPAAFDRLDHGALKGFAAAARTLNFTRAAEEAAMTQSGVSQHVARLERQLGAQLFTRVNRKVALTRAGELLLRFVDHHLEQTGGLLEQIHAEVGELKGLVRYGMPHSCLFTPHFPMLLHSREAFPKVDLDVSLIPNETIFKRLLDRQLDFGFVTRRYEDPAVRFEFFAREEYVLVGKDRAQLKGVTAKNVLQQRWVDYPGMDVLFELWARRALGNRRVHHGCLDVAGRIDSLHGAITMLLHGVGITVLPRHCVEKHLDEGRLEERRCMSPLKNDIHIVSLEGVRRPRRVQAVMDAFWEMVAGKY